MLRVSPASTAVTRIEINSTSPWSGGRSYGDVGPYVEMKGKVHFEVDPRDPANARVIDLGLAPVKRGVDVGNVARRHRLAQPASVGDDPVGADEVDLLDAHAPKRVHAGAVHVDDLADEGCG